MTNELVTVNGNSAMSAYGDRADVREIGDRLMAMHPAAKDVGERGMRAAAQLSLMLGANPLPGANELHVWKDNKDKICISLGINFWRRKAQEWGGVLYHTQARLMKSDEMNDYGIPSGTIAAICRGCRADDMLRYKREGFATQEIFSMCGRAGIASMAPNEYAKSGRPSVWTVLKRAETDMLRQLFPVQFGSIEHTAIHNDASIIDDDTAIIEGELIDEKPYTVNDFNNDFYRDTPVETDGEIVESQPAIDSKRVYEDGSPVDANTKAIETYDAYVKAHDGKAPANVHNLRNWYKSHNKNGNGDTQAQPAHVTEAHDQPLFSDDPDAAQAALDTALGEID